MTPPSAIPSAPRDRSARGYRYAAPVGYVAARRASLRLSVFDQQFPIRHPLRTWPASEKRAGLPRANIAHRPRTKKHQARLDVPSRWSISERAEDRPY